MDDVALVEALRSNQATASEEFHARFDPLIRYIAAWRKWGFSADVQEDVVQNTHAVLAKGVTRFRGDATLEQFVKKVCILRCLDELRRSLSSRDREAALVYRNSDGEWVDRDVASPKEVHPVTELVRAERLAALRAELGKLEDGCRSAILCFYEKGRSYKQMSQEMGVAVNTVGSRLARCLKKLRLMLMRHPVFGESM